MKNLPPFVLGLRLFWQGAHGFARSRQGVAAVEFALIAPLLLCMYLLTMEVSQAIEANKKIGRAGSMVADLITQQSEVTPTDLDAIMQIGSAILQPYNRSMPSLDVTAIAISEDPIPKATVAWSRKLSNNLTGPGVAKKSPADIPSRLMVPGTFLVRVDASIGYIPVILYSASQKQVLGLSAAFDVLNMNDRYYLRPRVSAQITCTLC